jgi:hypothetical protein
VMGAACAVICGMVAIVGGLSVARDQWVDKPIRWVGMVFAIVIGGGTVLHALGVW